MKFKILFLAMLFLSACIAFPYEEVKELRLSAQDIEMLEINCGAGFLKVTGYEGRNEIEVEAEIEVEGRRERDTEEFIRKYVELSLEKRGRRAVLISNFKDFPKFFSLGNTVINLTVSIPKNMDLDINDGSGSIRVENIAGNVFVDDGSGSMEIENVEGSLQIEDGSGSIEVDDVRDDVDVDDGSGSISIRNIGGSVTVRDGSGSIYINGVEKDVFIPSEGSGGLRISNVKGKVKY
ncbi:MAG: hypothetical protein OEY25_10790 [Candidatus Aminicenantes bacterium]|nr:hypothetical protein [Candidatus Aminicenantes bacterium]MDH5706812.1 hypothetical protein [Candidatus Aminicenantes bacterium]